jgi:signal transduction histidine kinase
VATLLIRFASEGTPEGGQIAVYHAVTTRAVLVHLQDGGRGATEERLTDLFDLFAQREDVRRGVPPELGLSLFTARRLIELQSGTVEASHGEPGCGLRIAVRLPLAADRGHGYKPAHVDGRS